VAPRAVLAIREPLGGGRGGATWTSAALAASLLLGPYGCSDGTAAMPGIDAGSAPFDAGSEEEAAAPAMVDYCAEAGSRGDGSTFADLYRDFFGPTGQASCSARSICHVPGGTGMQATGGYQCSPDEPTCWASMTSTIVPEGGSPTPEQTSLYQVLRKAPPTAGSGPMPRNSAFAFCPDDLARIRDWIEAGAPGP
jgi:hypothetical protein